MSCESIRVAVVDARYTQQRLSDDAAAHLQTCAACRAFAEQDALLDSVLSIDTPAVARPGFDTRMFARLAEERRAAQAPLREGLFGMRFLRWWMPVSAGAALAAVGGLLWMTRDQVSQPSKDVVVIVPTPARVAETVASEPSAPVAPITDDELAIVADLELLEELEAFHVVEDSTSLEALSAVAELDPAVLDALMNEVEP